MCGIVGYIGEQDVLPILINGLKRLEYRGYDSAGVAILNGTRFFVEKHVGKIINLEKALAAKPFHGTIGIGHTRWATHGAPSDLNAHPLIDCTGKIAVIHNGIIENWTALRKMLETKGHKFKTETDTEVLVHLIEHFSSEGLEQAVRHALSKVEGTYGIAVVSKDEPDKIVAARHGSPLVAGVGEGENFVASDISAIVGHTRNVIYLEDGEMAVISRSGIVTKTITNEIVNRQAKQVEFDLTKIEKGGFDHFMHKEIHEQAATVRDAMRGRLLPDEGTSKLGGLIDQMDRLQKAERIIITACGTSWHAGLIGEYLLEELARIPVEVEYASEFRYRDPVLSEKDIVLVISQSGETADTLAAMREAKRKGATVLAICNVVGSSIARESDGGVYIHAGPEIGVASTKAFTSQVTVLTLLALLLGRKRNLSYEQGREIVNELQALPGKIEQILKKDPEIKKLAQQYKDHRNFLYLGRGYNFPVALEGALKLKEISYIHAEGYPAAEMKHGPIALIDEQMPVICIATQDSIYHKVLSNIEEVRARRGRVIAVATEGDTEIAKKAEQVIYIPPTLKFLVPILAIIPLQLLAYHIAVSRGCNVDQPRNLAKSVTVE